MRCNSRVAFVMIRGGPTAGWGALPPGLTAGQIVAQQRGHRANVLVPLLCLSLDRLDVIEVKRRCSPVTVETNREGTAMGLAADYRAHLAGKARAAPRAKGAKFDPIAGLKFNLVGQRRPLKIKEISALLIELEGSIAKSYCEQKFAINSNARRGRWHKCEGPPGHSGGFPSSLWGRISLSFFGARAWSIARSASANASALVAAWPLMVILSKDADHFQICRPRP